MTGARAWSWAALALAAATCAAAAPAARGAAGSGASAPAARGGAAGGAAGSGASAAAAQAPGSLSVTISTRGQRALGARGVSLRATGSASRRGRTVTLPLLAADATALRTSGSVVLKRGKRSVSLGSPRLELGQNPRVTALLAGRRTTVLTLAVAPISSATGVTLEATSAALTAAAAKRIEQRLRLKAKLPRTAFATVAASGAFPQATPPSGPCRMTTAGGSAVTPGSGEPPVKARPAGARTITSATVTWRVRESFVQYINSGEGTSTSRGATGEPPEVAGASDAPLVYSFHFPFAEGWCDPATGAARIAFTGTVAFKYADHEIDLRVNDPEVELDGPVSRVIFRMTGSGDTDGGNQRAVVETLDVSKAAVSGAAPAFAYERIPAAVPPGAATSVFAGYYLPGDPFGWVSISFTTD
jgi:Htaa